MNPTKIRAFMDALNLDIAVERVGENETIPLRWREGTEHFRAMLSRPGARECHFQFSTRGLERTPTVFVVFYLAACSLAEYEAAPTPEHMSTIIGLPLEDVVEQWHTFEAERRDLMRFFGEHYADFLELAHD